MWMQIPIPWLPAALMLAVFASAWAGWQRIRPGREAWLLAAVTWGLLIWGVTELQSLLKGLSHGSAVASWIGLAIASCIAAWWVKRRLPSSPVPKGPRSPLDPFSWALLAGVGLMWGLLGVLAWRAWPMSWDALGYHLPRVMHWVQQGSVAFFEAPNQRMNFMSPWPGFAQLQLYLLSGSDRLASLLQWTCYALALVAASKLAETLGATPKVQVLGVVIAATVPSAVLQAPTPLTDLIVTLWLMIFVYYGWRLIVQPSSGVDAFAAGSSLALACLSKGTAFVLAAPWVLAWIGACLLRRARDRRRDGPTPWRQLGAVVLVAVIPLLILLPHTVRNLKMYGHPTTPAFHRELIMNRSHDPRLVVSNMIRGVLCNTGTPFERHGAAMERLSARLHRWMGVVDGDPANSFRGQSLQVHPMTTRVESISGNLGHLLAYLLAAALAASAAAGWRRWPLSKAHLQLLLMYGACLLAGYVLFCAQVKYQVYIMRLQLPLWMLAAPACAVVLHEMLPRKIGQAVAIVLLALALPYVVAADHRSLLGPRSVLRSEYRQRPPTMEWHEDEDMDEVGRYLHNRGVKRIGLVCQEDEREYLWWWYLRRMYVDMPWLERVQAEETVEPSSRSDIAPPPYVVNWMLPLGPRIAVRGWWYERVWAGSKTTIYRRVE